MSTDPKALAMDLEALLHHDIPLTRDMGLRVLAWEGQCLTLGLPLAPNVNHQHTQFGGSLYCGAVLAGWGWLHLALSEAGETGGHVVIQDGHIEYPLPVRGDAQAICPAPEAAVWQRFLKTWRRHGRARIELQTYLREAGQTQAAVRFTGQYVLHR
ncbi:thioesterase domain-containing protein [Pseudomonas typographi]|uniref:thioesterase domain-containing protein n=1 Tax=Pseudomonas typographi TaxID=2715964 RepID=UPI001689083E|nr:thioesterase domain-containing protein [Pseudomonas typographi]MBD1586123.1 thioesterase [Pseudomonas typographi]